ncbi:transaminase, acetylornithine/succinylornithine family [Lachnoanaerobaculum sp. MSX33]|uniref:aspartate aminotransferase family protein n=1 Tax=Lachnoanaerobaculum sp. MSX33 TaxID=936596 RepID=UPI0003DF9BA9|nr:aspartate aminotransferase family protein [Lachnoanaerobaculum sp. MSX33]ETO95070.1 transaminase, acetylornithine/succinylornithine family [Lachnoanaerobaculum sp. MSX33]
MKMKDSIDCAEQLLLKIYNRYQVVFDHGDGIKLFDTDGNEYLDFFAGIAVQGLGYNYKGVNEALKAQADKLWHISNYFYNEPVIEAGEKLIEISRMEKVFFTNSGTEAIEGAIKIAKKYGTITGGRFEIIAMEGSFHGRSLGALSVTGNEHYREDFYPLIPGVKFAKYNDIESVKKLVSDKTCAIILETVQGEGGIHPATKEFLEGIKKLTDEHDLILIFDEIQCGMGRTGQYFAWQEYGIKPDVMTAAKALGNGVPIGAFLTSGKASDVLKPGDHGSTYGGNPLVCAVVSKVLDIFKEDYITGNVKAVGDYLKEKLEGMVEEYPFIKEVRGKGLLLGMEFDRSVADIIKHALLDEKMVLINAGSNVLRFIPPLIISKEDVDDALERLKRVLNKF